MALYIPFEGHSARGDIKSFFEEAENFFDFPRRGLLPMIRPREHRLRLRPYMTRRIRSPSSAEDECKMLTTPFTDNVVGRIFDELSELKDISERGFTASRQGLGNDLPLVSPSAKGGFEVNVNIGNCDPEDILVDVKDGLLKVEGKKELPGGSYTYICHEQTIPNGVPVSSLKASLRNDGVLRVRQEVPEEEVSVVLPVSREDSKNAKDDKKKKDEDKRKEQSKETTDKDK